MVRPLGSSGFAEWRRMRTALWPDQTEADMHAWLARGGRAAVLVAERPGGAGLCGFIEVGERDFADGCATSPVGYIEGWWVDPDSRRHGIGRALVQAAEDWCRGRGLTELASDAEIDNEASLRAHRACGFEEAGRVVVLTKAL